MEGAEHNKYASNMLQVINVQSQSSVYEKALEPLRETAKILDLHESIVKVLSEPEKTLIVSLPIRMDDGQIEVFTGYRVRHNTARGPAKGGIRYHPNVCLDEVKALAYWMTLKNGVVGLAYGGGKGGITCDPKKMSKAELERLTRSYASAIARFIGPNLDVPASDVGTDSQMMGWFMDEYIKIVGQSLPSIITAKPLSIGGSKGRETATGRGTFFVTVEAAKAFSMPLKGASVSIQGYGKVARPVAQYLYDVGCKIVAVSDSTGGAYNAKGMHPLKLVEHKKSTGSVKGFPGSIEIGVVDPITVDCDVLIPAALENQITEKNAHEVKSKLLIEEANGPTTPEADKILRKKGVIVIPDILANAGGVTVSYFEWVQNRMGYYWTEEEVDEKLKTVMVKAFTDTYETCKEHEVDMRTGAYTLSISRLVDAMKALGRI